MTPETVEARSAIESLRSGVPSRNAVAQLGTTQTDVREEFEASLETLTEGVKGVSPLVLSATFGAGKTHLLEYLQSLAEGAGFVTSYVVVSPEMPLGNGHLVLKALSEAAIAPEQTGKALRALASNLNTTSDSYSKLKEWAIDSGINGRFPAMLHLYSEYRADEDFRVQLLNDFEGRPLLKTLLKSRLKQINAAPNYDLSGPPNAALAHDRIRLLAQIFRASGCKGWVILFDEFERISRFSANQRLAAYSELGWWRKTAEMAGAAILPVFTTASGFYSETLEGGAQDEQRFKNRSYEQDDRDRDAVYGIELLKSKTRLDSPTSQEEEDIKYRVKQIYEEAYNVTASLELAKRRDVRTSIRSEIRRWITLWDLQRYSPDYEAVLENDQILFDTADISDAEMLLSSDNNENYDLDEARE